MPEVIVPPGVEGIVSLTELPDPAFVERWERIILPPEQKDHLLNHLLLSLGHRAAVSSIALPIHGLVMLATGTDAGDARRQVKRCQLGDRFEPGNNLIRHPGRFQKFVLPVNHAVTHGIDGILSRELFPDDAESMIDGFPVIPACEGFLPAALCTDSGQGAGFTDFFDESRKRLRLPGHFEKLELEGGTPAV